MNTSNLFTVTIVPNVLGQSQKYFNKETDFVDQIFISQVINLGTGCPT